ncbi:hypothetical protein F5878DRAFT_64882 [Lentinula raphanica]|uniref:Uncharacterized protein n=1 Tax=Lentinula raphanica TaxID=153919 RepID=A0AA38PDG1_9AGAR|nr:hypothetical protein F5878DRAFT_64882 [Lentinula raphanica]
MAYSIQLKPGSDTFELMGTLILPEITVLKSLSFNHNFGPMQSPEVHNNTKSTILQTPDEVSATLGPFTNAPVLLPSAPVLVNADARTAPDGSTELASLIATGKDKIGIRAYFKPRTRSHSSLRKRATRTRVSPQVSTAASLLEKANLPTGPPRKNHNTASPVSKRPADSSQTLRDSGDANIASVSRGREFPLSKDSGNERAESSGSYGSSNWQEIRGRASSPEVNTIPATGTNANGAAQHQQSASAEVDLVDALASAFASNADNNDLDEFDGSSFGGSDSDSVVEIPRRSSRRRAPIIRVPQIPASPALNRLRQEWTTKEASVPPSEKALEEYLEVEHIPVHLPLGVSIAPGNDSEYVDPDTEVSLDYDASADVNEAREKQQQLKRESAPKVLSHNLRFLKQRNKQTSARGFQAPNVVPQYNVTPVPSTTAFLQRVETMCGEQALDLFQNELRNWEHMPKPRKLRSRLPAERSHRNSKETTPAASSDIDEVPGRKTRSRRAQIENDSRTRKRVKFSEESSAVSTATTGILNENAEDASGESRFDAVFCGELLQKLIKGKVQIAAQELQSLLSFLEDPFLVYMANKFQNGEDLPLSASISQAYDSIWRALRYIGQSSSGTLGISEGIEDMIRGEAQRIMSIGV